MAKISNFDIAIIGGSFAGMTCALALAEISSELKIALIEKEPIFAAARKNDGRAYAISASTMKLFAQIGIAEILQSESVAGRIEEIVISDKKSPLILNFLGVQANQPSTDFNFHGVKQYLVEKFLLSDEQNHELNANENSADCDSNQQKQALGLIIENHILFEALKNKVSLTKNISVFCPNSYQKIDLENKNFSSNSVIELDDGNQIAAKLVLACDGRFSQIRNAFKIKFWQKNYDQTALVCLVDHQFKHQNCAFEKFLGAETLAILPMADSYQSSIVWIVSDEKAKLLLELDEANFNAQLLSKFPEELGQCQFASEKFSYPLVAVLAEKFFEKNLLLIGDAACGIHPVAGQGFNLAVANIAILRNLIRQNLYCGLDIGSSQLLDSYNRKARANCKKMLFATDFLVSLFGSQSLVFEGIRKLGLGLVNELGPLKKFFIAAAGGK